LIPGAVEQVKAQDSDNETDMPRVDELLVSVRDFLRNDVMAETNGRTNFLSRVAGNSLDIVLRDTALGEPSRRAELQRLQNLFGEGDLNTLRWKLVNGLRQGEIALDTPGLADHLRNTVANQVAIDQPKYSGLATALKN
jgi:hypothetical protein